MILFNGFNGAAIDPIIQPDAITHDRPLIPGYYHVEVLDVKHLYSLPSDRIQ
jgi:hypothetical protein